MGKKEPITLGKKYAGEPFSTVRTVEDVAEAAEVNREHDVANAIPIDAWFVMRGHRDPVMQSAMLTYTKVTKATAEAFDKIFEKF